MNRRYFRLAGKPTGRTSRAAGSDSFIPRRCFRHRFCRPPPGIDRLLSTDVHACQMLKIFKLEQRLLITGPNSTYQTSYNDAVAKTKSTTKRNHKFNAAEWHRKLITAQRYKV